MAVRVAINGFGRTGRAFLRAAVKSPHGVEVAAVNDLGAPDALARLLARDSVHGQFPLPVTVEHDTMLVGSSPVTMLMEPHPAELPWRELGIDVVIESTGRLTSRREAAAHIEAGARRVIISAPAKDADATFVMGVNEDGFDPSRDFIVSNASCTTNCLAVHGQGARRRLRHGRGVHDDGPRLHGRPAPRRRAAQGRAARPRGRDQHRAHHDRRRPGDGPRAARRGGTPRRALAPGPGARRVDHRSGRDPPGHADGR